MLLRRANSSEAPTRQPHRGQMLTLARCLRVGVDEFGALDKIAAVQLEGAPTFGLLDQPLEQGVQPRVGGLATCGEFDSQAPRADRLAYEPEASSVVCCGRDRLWVGAAGFLRYFDRGRGDPRPRIRCLTLVPYSGR